MAAGSRTEPCCLNVGRPSVGHAASGDGRLDRRRATLPSTFATLKWPEMWRLGGVARDQAEGIVTATTLLHATFGCASERS